MYHPLKVNIRGKAHGRLHDVDWIAHVYRNGRYEKYIAGTNLFELEDYLRERYPDAHITLTRPRHPGLRRSR
jgi:hypothetical protein